MLTLRLEGSLTALMATLSRAMDQPTWVFRYGLVSTTAPADGLFGSLSLGSAGALSMPTTGGDALVGEVRSLSVGMAPITDPSNFVNLLFVEGLNVDAPGVFDLVARVPGGAQVRVDDRPLIAGLNAEACRITGSDGADIVAATSVLRLARNDTISGGRGADDLAAGPGDDRVFGGSGADRLRGGTGNDSLTGGKGNDQLKGAAGADVFVFGTGFGDDVITDFQDRTDRIDVAAKWRVVDAGADTVIHIGTDSIRLVDVDHRLITAADFI
jgi:Ca2+-binding RTX toxin-like protein